MESISHCEKIVASLIEMLLKIEENNSEIVLAIDGKRNTQDQLVAIIVTIGTYMHVCIFVYTYVYLYVDVIWVFVLWLLIHILMDGKKNTQDQLVPIIVTIIVRIGTCMYIYINVYVGCDTIYFTFNTYSYLYLYVM